MGYELVRIEDETFTGSCWINWRLVDGVPVTLDQMVEMAGGPERIADDHARYGAPSNYMPTPFNVTYSTDE